jgi:signal transduction histidine kinase
MAVSRAVAEGRALDETLATIAETGAALVGAQAAAIVLRRSESASGLAVAGAWGLDPEYASALERVRPIEVGSGPSGLAAATGSPVTVDDVFTDPLFGPWRTLAAREHYRAVVSVPLRLGSPDRVIGVLNAYRPTPGEWPREHLELLLTLADHAAIAIQTAQLLEESRRQVRGLSLVVSSLRAQGHEHANLVHALSGLLAIGEAEEAQALMAAADERYRLADDRIGGTIENAVVAGFLLAETAIAGNGGIELELDPASRLAQLPPGVSDLDAITIIGNLIHNATDAVADAPHDRRRVAVALSGDAAGLTLRVRDWGDGIAAQDADRVFESGHTTKHGHAGVGLSLVRGAVHRAGGEVEVEPDAGPGAAFVVRIPRAAR